MDDDIVFMLLCYVFLGREMAMPKDFSESTAKIIDDEVRKIITGKEEELMQLFKTHKKEIITLSDKLVEKELIYADEIKALIDL
mgnify:CR=1 FL=1